MRFPGRAAGVWVSGVTGESRLVCASRGGMLRCWDCAVLQGFFSKGRSHPYEVLPSSNSAHVGTSLILSSLWA